MPKLTFLFVTIALLLFVPLVTAHGGDVTSNDVAQSSKISDFIVNNTLNVVIIAVALILVLTTLSVGVRNLTKKLKLILFALITLVTLSTTLFLAGSTIYLNLASVSKGPVHYHADIQIYKCGEELDLKDPEGFSNKVGTSTVHEHNDKRIHIEGVLLDEKDASLGNYFTSIGGDLHQSSLNLPTHEGIINLKNGDKCPDGQAGTLQVFVYKTTGEKYFQSKISTPQDYVISPNGNVPPGDCVIVEFDREKEQTERICQSYQVAKELNKIHK